MPFFPTADGQIAIEVELTLKNRSRLAEIAHETSHTYDRVWYFARPTIVPALRKIANESGWGNIDVCLHTPSQMIFLASQALAIC